MFAPHFMEGGGKYFYLIGWNLISFLLRFLPHIHLLKNVTSSYTSDVPLFELCSLFPWSIICLLLFSLMLFQGNKNKMLVETCMCLLSSISVSCLLIFWGSLTAAKLNTFAGLRLNKSNWLLVCTPCCIGISSERILFWGLKIGSLQISFISSASLLKHKH